ncbi:hypothetical protein FQN54_004579 [Arachnomyces sp. PD_36]|nr:hypothetical protein FQN54_004579 [Arachnomyces sp. PD_36]
MSSNANLRPASSPSPSPSPPQKFPKSGFAELNPTEKIEEEDLPFYNPEDYYPVHIGEVFQSRYQVVSKLGYGGSSTVWLCRDLWKHQYLTLKVCVRTKQLHPVKPASDHEITVSNHLQSFSFDHPGKSMIRTVLDSFEIPGPNGHHKCLLYQPLGMSYTEFLKLHPKCMFAKELVQRSAQLLLLTLDYLHQCHVVHTDISSNNLLQGIRDDSILSQIEQDEMKQPIARKTLSDRTIYNSRLLPVCAGVPVLCDLGEARLGNQKHRGDIMPGIYRAPEVILGMDWDYKVDIWSVGVMVWDIFEGGNLFFAKKNGMLDDEQHLAEMVSLMGPPPVEFLKRSEKCLKYWDEQGNWKGSVPIPEQSLETREWRLEGDDHILLIKFLRKMLRWIPEERPTGVELAYDDFLMQAVAEELAQRQKTTESDG